jgi:hypothetical protein
MVDLLVKRTNNDMVLHSKGVRLMERERERGNKKVLAIHSGGVNETNDPPAFVFPESIFELYTNHGFFVVQE